MSYSITLMKDIKDILEGTNILEYADELYDEATTTGEANLIGDTAILVHKINDVIWFLTDMIMDYDYLDDYGDEEEVEDA